LYGQKDQKADEAAAAQEAKEMQEAAAGAGDDLA
jgi:hypothetical protein